MEQRAARRLDQAHPLAAARPLDNQVRALQVLVVQQVADLLSGVQQFDHARPVIGHRDVVRLAVRQLHEFLASRLGLGCVDEIAGVDAGKRADPVPPLLGPERANERELHVRPRLDLLGEVIGILLVVDLVEELAALRVDCAQVAVVQIHRAVLADQRKVVGFERAEIGEVLQVFDRVILRDLQGAARPCHDLFDVLEEGVAFGDGQVFVDTAGDRAGAVDLLAGGGLDDFLPVLAQHHALHREIREFPRHADDVADRGIGVEPEQQVRRYEVEEVQRVRLEHLAVVHQAAHLFRRRRQRVHAGDAVHRLGRREMVADRADPAEALDQHRHLPVRPALDEAFEPAEFHDVQASLLHLPLFIQKDRDLAVSFDAGDGLDDDFVRLGCCRHISHSLSRKGT